MSRIASVKETGEEVGEEEWKRFEEAVAAEVRRRPTAEPSKRGLPAREPRTPESRDPSDSLPAD